MKKLAGQADITEHNYCHTEREHDRDDQAQEMMVNEEMKRGNRMKVVKNNNGRIGGRRGLVVLTSDYGKGGPLFESCRRR